VFLQLLGLTLNLAPMEDEKKKRTSVFASIMTNPLGKLKKVEVEVSISQLLHILIQEYIYVYT
jgi:hypothetical protein